MASEKLCLKWNDFQNIIQTSFGELRSDSDFTDVTLACEDESIEAHKVILSACSPFFKRLLKTNSHPQPLIYMRGLKLVDLVAVVDFIYRGEANVFQDQLESFLSLAEEFELKGLSGSSKEATPDISKEFVANQYQRDPGLGKKRSTNEEGTTVKHESNRNTFDKALMIPIQQNEKRTTTVINPDTMAVVESMVEKRIDGYGCTNCDYTSKKTSNVREHAEKHIAGLEYPCNVCNKVYRSSNSFRTHKRRGEC